MTAPGLAQPFDLGTRTEVVADLSRAREYMRTVYTEQASGVDFSLCTSLPRSLSDVMPLEGTCGDVCDTLPSCQSEGDARTADPRRSLLTKAYV
jgi:hypothetical protein